MKSSLSLSLLILITACSTSATRTMTNNGDDQSGGTEVIPPAPPALNSQLEADPTSYLQNLPKIYTDNFPSTFRRFSIFATSPTTSAEFLHYTTGAIDSSLTVAETEARIGTIPALIKPLFNTGNSGYNNIVGYKGTASDLDGATSDSLHGKSFTLLAGDQTITFGYFDDPDKGLKFYSYDPASNKIGDLEATLATGAGTAPNNTFSYSFIVTLTSGKGYTLYVFQRQ